MNYQHANFSEMENVRLSDSVIRISTSIGTVLAVLLIPVMPATMLVALTLIAIYAGLTAFLGWDPFYALLKKSQPQPQTSAPATVTSRSSRAEQPSTGGHKKAA